MWMAVGYCMYAVAEREQLLGVSDSRIYFRSMLQNVVGMIRLWNKGAEIQIRLVVAENVRHGDNHSGGLRKRSPRSVHLQDIAELAVGRI